MNKHSSPIKYGIDEDFEIMGDMPKEDPVVFERRRLRENKITKILGEYLLKGYCMLDDVCPDCDCVLLRTPENQLLCVGCAEIDMKNKDTVSTTQPKTKKKDRKKKPSDNGISHCNRLENKLKWAVDELTKSQNPDRISAMCTSIIKLTETIQAFKKLEMTSS